MYERKKRFNSGYILLENIVAFTVVVVIIMEISPLIVYMRQQRLVQQAAVEAYRYGYEVCYDRCFQQGKVLPPSIRGRTRITPTVEQSAHRVRGITLQTDANTFSVKVVSAPEGL